MSDGIFESKIRSFDEVCAIAKYRQREIAEQAADLALLRAWDAARAMVKEQAAEIKRLKVIEEAAKNVTGYPSPIALAELCEALELDDE